MALSPFQREVCRVLAQNRRELGGYVDVFHDTREALDATWNGDRKRLHTRGYGVESVRELPGFVEAVIARGRDRVLMQ